jgi:hypothetical protein
MTILYNFCQDAYDITLLLVCVCVRACVCPINLVVSIRSASYQSKVGCCLFSELLLLLILSSFFYFHFPLLYSYVLFFYPSFHSFLLLSFFRIYDSSRLRLTLYYYSETVASQRTVTSACVLHNFVM